MIAEQIGVLRNTKHIFAIFQLYFSVIAAVSQKVHQSARALAFNNNSGRHGRRRRSKRVAARGAKRRRRRQRRQAAAGARLNINNSLRHIARRRQSLATSRAMPCPAGLMRGAAMRARAKFGAVWMIGSAIRTIHRMIYRFYGCKFFCAKIAKFSICRRIAIEYIPKKI